MKWECWNGGEWQLGIYFRSRIFLQVRSKEMCRGHMTNTFGHSLALPLHKTLASPPSVYKYLTILPPLALSSFFLLTTGATLYAPNFLGNRSLCKLELGLYDVSDVIKLSIYARVFDRGDCADSNRSSAESAITGNRGGAAALRARRVKVADFSPTSFRSDGNL